MTAFGSLTRRQLKFTVRVKPLSPVHIGVGNEFLGRGAYHLYDENRRLALVSPRPLAAALLDHFGDQAVTHVPKLMQSDQYPPKVATQIENGTLSVRRMDVHPGAVPHLLDTGRNGGLKVMTSQANGLPYIPGSSLKGALRTAWLDWQTQQKGSYTRFAEEVARTKLRGRDADDDLMDLFQATPHLVGLENKVRAERKTYPNRDVFRAVQVSDLLPSRIGTLTKAYSVLSMSYDADPEEGYTRPSDSGKAGSQAWECLDYSADVEYAGTITVDMSLLDQLLAKDDRQKAKYPDVYQLVDALKRPQMWSEAISAYGQRFYSAELQHYEGLRERPLQRRKGIRIHDGGRQQLVLDWIKDPKRENLASRLLPLGMGVGLMAHTLLGAFNPNFDGENPDSAEYLGDEQYFDTTLTGEVLKSGKPNNGFAYLPSPKSRRVTGEFPDSGRRQGSYTTMQAERPLGWTELTLEVMPS
ncbi:type III-A CRISPR-associated RAMP protein Csm5 [Deinococcus taklimakanensis]|uniref:CRISPR system Cms protein Csm5 n=1 Tax=Deinococcus taklimakanensis TaxID=536443 RepID=A0ABW5P3D1_9DEIO